MILPPRTSLTTCMHPLTRMQPQFMGLPEEAREFLADFCVASRCPGCGRKETTEREANITAVCVHCQWPCVKCKMLVGSEVFEFKLFVVPEVVALIPGSTEFLRLEGWSLQDMMAKATQLDMAQ